MVRFFPRSALGRCLELGHQQEAPGARCVWFPVLKASELLGSPAMDLHQSWSQLRERPAAHPWQVVILNSLARPGFMRPL